MQYKPANWVTGFKRSPRAANVQNRDMGLFLNSSGKFEPIDDAWDSIHSGGIFISDDNKLYFRDETNKDIYINSPTAETLVLGAGNATTAGFVTINEEGFDTDFRVEASGEANALFVQGSSGYVGIGKDSPTENLHVKGEASNYATVSIETASDAHGSEIVFADSTDADYGSITQFASSSGEGGRMRFRAAATETMNLRGGNMGIGTNNPGTLLELFGTAPYLTLRNSTHENGDGGRESKIIFEGEKTDGSDSTLAVIQASHDGTSDDQKGDLIFYTNDGNDNAAPNERLRIDSAGNVGIGATAPLAPFEVKSTTNPIAMFSYNDSYNGEVFIAGTQVNAGYDRNANATLYLNYNGYANGTTQFRDTIIADGKNNTVLMSDGSAGNVGIGATPGTLLELFGTAPYLTLRNSTHENTDGGRESKIIFEGEKTDGSDSTLAVIQASHDGTSDDQKGDLIFYTNDGNDNAAPTERLRIDSAGYVGIGTTSTDKQTEIKITDSNNTAGLKIVDTSDETATYLGQFSNTTYFINNATYSGGWAADDTDVPVAGINLGDGIALSTAAAGATSPTARVSIDSAGDVEIDTGNLVIGTAGKGIDFSNQASPAAGMTSELLDRYEEGTCTLTCKGATSDPTSAVTETAAYTRIGRQVTVTCYFSGKDTSGASGSWFFDGLPFTSANEGTWRGTGGIMTYGMTISGEYLGISMNANATNFHIYVAVSGGAWLGQAITAGTGKNWHISLTYFV